MKKYIRNIGLSFCLLIAIAGCTKLDEEVYDQVDAANFLTRRDDVIRDFLRPFEHAYWSIQGNDVYAVGEDSSDEMGLTTARETGKTEGIINGCITIPGLLRMVSRMAHGGIFTRVSYCQLTHFRIWRELPTRRNLALQQMN